MIVISGALVLVALVLLVIGIAAGELPFVYASIIVSLVSLAFLVVGILQRRGEMLPDEEPASDDTATEPVSGAGDSSTTVAPVQPAAPDTPPIADSADEELETGGTVLVVTGRPRYHVVGCRYLTGKAAEPVEVRDAREGGFTPCGVCKPDAALVAKQAPLPREDVAGQDLPQEDAAGQDLPHEDVAGDDVAGDDVAGDDAAGDDVAGDDAAQDAMAVDGAARDDVAEHGAPAGDGLRDEPAAGVVEVVPVPVKRAGRKPAAASSRVTRKAVSSVDGPPQAGPTAAPSSAALLAAESTPEAASATRSGSVVVIPDRGRFHLPQCRYVRGVAGAQVLTRDAASQQGYVACGVCKP